MRNSQRGMSLGEVLVGLMILSVMILTTLTATTTALRLTKNNTNKEFATQKAISMLEELRSLVQTSNGTTLTFLDAYDDGTQNQDILTTQGQKPLTTLPGDLISGNTPRGTGWLYERRISVQPVPGQGNDVRFVNVKVFMNENGQQRLLAEVASVLRTLVVDMPPTQVYDVYAVAVENVPGWWVYMSNIVPFVRSTVSDLQARNPGLTFRMHWINTLSYGRDWQYKPFSNETTRSTDDIPWVYFYPGRMPDPATGMPVGDDYYYPWFLFRGVMNRDNDSAGGFNPANGYDSSTNPWPYAIADQFNNGMRYDDELAYYNLRKAANPNEELTWRLLIEQMYSNPAQYTNAIVINLHGEMLPFPPVRNYSDAAKSPESYPRIRAVTHPEQLRYTNTEDVKLRVYTYRTDPDNAAAGTNYLGETSGYDIPVTIKISGTTGWTPSGSDVQIIRGGTSQDATPGPDPYDAAPVNAPTAASGNQMYYTKSTIGTDVVLKLYKSPLKQPQTSSGAGLNAAARLYGLEYIPSPLEDLTQTTTANQFKSRHLGSTCCDEIQALRDMFNSAVYTANNGTVNFAGDWIEQNDGASNATSGNIQVVGNQLRIGDNFGTGGGNDSLPSMVYRVADLRNFDTAQLTFTYATANVDAGHIMIVEASGDGGTTWTTLHTYSGPAADTESYDLTPFIAANTRIRFRSTNYTTAAPTDYFNVDNVQIEGKRLGTLPKNTARWIITIPDAKIADNSKLVVETRLGDTTTTGVMYPPASASVPPNLSRTYVWRGDDTWIFGDGTNTNPPHLPITETFQFMGDPRHLPYADLKRPHAGSGFGANYENRLGMGYNPYFDDFENAAVVLPATPFPASGNLTAVEIVARETQNYTFNSITNVFAVIVDGTTSVSVTLPTGTAQTAANVAATLNGNAGFSAVAVADVTSSRVRLKSKNKGGSIEYDNQIGTNGALFGFEGSTIWNATTGVPWPGWRYTAPTDGLSYGIKNNGTNDDDTWHNIEIDVSRGFQMVRSGLINSSALWTTMTGYSYYYMGIGNEIGYDSANNFDNSIPISTKPYTGVTGKDWEQTIIDANNMGCNLGCGVKYIRQQSTVNGWWSLSWIGELYPDSQYAAESNWKANGNLRTGVGATYYVRADRETMPPFTGTILERSERRPGPRGSTTLFWGETAASAFHHEGTDGDATILADGIDIRDNFSLPVPDTIPNNRPWQVDWNATGNNPENFLTGTYPPADKLRLLQRYFKRIITATEPTEASALVAVTEPTKGRPAFIVVNGLSPTGITGTTFIAKWSFLTLIQSYLNGGKYNDTEVYPDPPGPAPAPTPGKTFHIPQLPRIAITDPNQNTPLKDPSTVKIAWTEKWTRWDGLRYSNAYPAGCQDLAGGCYTPAFIRKYIVLYSPSNGAPDAANGNPTGWFYTDDGTSAPLGGRVLAHSVTTMLVNLSTPKATFPEGNYLFRVEAYREGYEQHYSFHQYRAYIQR